MTLIRTIAVALGVLGAVLASQLPEFVQQYRQRLGGAIDELATIVVRFDADASVNGLTREAALAKLAQSPDDVVRRRAVDASENIRRLCSLEDQRRLMNEAGPLGQIAHFADRADPALTRATFRDFAPAVPTTAAGLLTAFVGFIIGWGLVHFTAWPVRRWRDMRQRRIRLG